jgi:hypothetical protein
VEEGITILLAVSFAKNMVRSICYGVDIIGVIRRKSRCVCRRLRIEG